MLDEAKKKLTDIIEAWKSLATGKGFNIQEAQRRAEICAACPFYNDTLKKVGMATCQKCGCVIAAKTKHMKSSCPIGKWTKFDENKS